MQSPEPNKKMEDLLRACAKKRREEGPPSFDLPHDVRARLQEEVRRSHAKTAPSPAPRRSLPMLWWVRLVLGGGIAALVALMIWPKASPPGKIGGLAPGKNPISAIRGESAELAAGRPQEKRQPASDAATLADRDQLVARRAAEQPDIPARRMVEPTAMPAPAAAAPPSGGSMLLAENGQLGKDAALKKQVDGVATDSFNFANSTSTLSDDTEKTRIVTNSPALAYSPPGSLGGVGGVGGGGGFGGSGGGGGRGRRGGGGSPVPGGSAGVIVGGATDLSGNFALSAANRAPAPAGNLADTTNGIFPDNLETAKTKAAADGSSRQFFAMAAPQPGRADSQINFAAAKAGASGPGVLASFQVQRAGRQIRIVDADGSIYQGQVETMFIGNARMAANNAEFDFRGASPNAASGLNGPAAGNYGSPGQFQNGLQFQNKSPAVSPPQSQQPASQAAPVDAVQNRPQPAPPAAISGVLVAGAPPPAAPAAPQAQESAAAGTFTFQVSGVSKRLNQSVTLSGTFFSAAVAGQNASPAVSGRAENHVSNDFAPAPAAQVWRVTGRVRVGPANQFDLDALSVQP